MKKRIAVVDDEPRMVEILTMVLRKDGHSVSSFTSSSEAAEAIGDAGFDLVITDLKMPSPDGLELLRLVRESSPRTPVILLTAHATVATAVAALRDGAFDYVEKPFENDELLSLVGRALELQRLARENRYLRAELRSRHAIEDIVAESGAMQEVLDVVRRAAPSPATVLVTGESGTGKELVARAIHYHSDRVGAPFVAVNCKALASGVLESELFGHERGAFTGALRSRPGLFEQADGGTLFLDEIGDIDAEFQAKLLRVIQDREVRPVGGNSTRTVDVRLVAATNKNLKVEVGSGRFREDLYFRLAVIPIHLKPLRERREDILPIARRLLEKWNEELGRDVGGWSEEAEKTLLGYDWPGNVRELENTLERAVVLAKGDRLEAEDLMIAAPSAGEGGMSASLRALLDRATAAHIQRALAETGGRKAEAAERLGIDRVTLYRLMRKHGLS
jgi:DNA-binding NtrC family response regulator